MKDLFIPKNQKKIMGKKLVAPISDLQPKGENKVKSAAISRSDAYTMVWPYYENGLNAIVVGHVESMASLLDIDEKSIGEGIDYILCSVHLPHDSGKDDMLDPSVDLGPVLPLTESDLFNVKQMVKYRKRNNEEYVCENKNFFLRFREGKGNFYFDIQDKHKRERNLYGLAEAIVFDDEKLEKLEEMLNNF